MIFVDNQNINDPTVNLALEEYLVRNVHHGEDMLLFYINAPSIIVGRHQNTIEEINRDYVADNNIYVVRRLSGGGAVYHDLGNLNFSYITPYRKEDFNNFKKFTLPVLSVLKKMGVPAELNGRNDILVDGKKISGNAQFISTQRMVSHGTLLFNSDLACVREALKVKVEKITSKGIKSVRSQVTNISEYTNEQIDIMEFRSRILREIFGHKPSIPEIRLDEEQMKEVLNLAQDRYRNWDWNYGRSPEYNIQKSRRFSFGEIFANIEVVNGLINSMKIFGDFFAEDDLSNLESCLVGIKYERAEILQVVRQVNMDHYFKELTSEEFVDFLY